MQLRNSHLLGSGAIVALLSLAPALSPAFAQETAPPVDTGPVQIASEEIVVVGTAGGGMRRQDAAFALTTLSSDAIARAAPQSTADLLRTIPGISAESSGGQNGANIFVRGYPSGGDAQFVTFQSSGVPIFPPPTLSFLENSQLIRLDETVERVEAVRGGTGSLFSNGQPGLTVNVVQRTGGDTLKGLAKVSYTDYDEIRGDAYVSGPLGDDTGFMIGGYYAQGNGIRDPQFRSEKGGQITANIKHDFAGRGSVLIYVRYLNDHGQWLLPIPVVQEGSKISGFPRFDPHNGALASKEIQNLTRLDGSHVNLADGRGADIINTGLNFDYEVADGLRVRERASFMGGHANTTGLVPAGPPQTAAAYAESRGGTLGSLTYANGGGAVSPDQMVMVGNVWTVEKKLSAFVNDLGLEFERGKNKLSGGFYFANYTARDRWNLGNGLLLTAHQNARALNMTLADGSIVTSNGFVSGSTYNLQANYTGTDYALYAVDELQLTDQLRLDGGVRWQRHLITGTVRQPNTVVNADGDPNTLYDNSVSVPGDTYDSIDYSSAHWSFTAGANYEFTDYLSAFARFSRGYGFPQFDNLREGLDVDAKIDTYEGGVKLSTPFLNLYATLFHNKFDGLANATLTGEGTIRSLGGAKATGVELEGLVRPVDFFSVAFAGTWLDASYRDYVTTSGGTLINNDGNQVQRQPKWAWRVTPAFDFDVGGFRPSVYGTVIYTGDRWSDPENTQKLPSFYQVDAGISVEVMQHFTIAVSGNNLTNAIGLTEGNPRVLGAQGAGVVLARPILGRSFRFSAAYSF